jgi:hypothetical protein
MDATSTVRPPASSTAIEIIVGLIGKRLAFTWSPRLSTTSPAASSTISPNGSMSARASVEKVESRRFPANASSAWLSSSVSSVVTCGTGIPGRTTMPTPESFTVTW